MVVGFSRLVGIAVASLLIVVPVYSTYYPYVGTILQNVEIDVCAEIYRIVDGDTFDAFPIGRVRLADIDAPELGTPEGGTSKQALSDLVSRYGADVYLDIDDIYVMDRYNRVVAVAYLRYNRTHVINVNKWLIDNGYANVSDYLNEFDPYTWTLYIYLPHNPCAITTSTQTSTVERTTTVAMTSFLTAVHIQTIEKTTTVTKVSTYISTVETTSITTSTATVTATYTLVTGGTATVTETVTRTIAYYNTVAEIFTSTYTNTLTTLQTVTHVTGLPATWILLLFSVVPIAGIFLYTFKRRR